MKVRDLVASVLVFSSAAFAQPQDPLPAACLRARMTEVASLHGLPSPVLQLLGAGPSDSGRIADRGADFNATDVHNGLPARRLVAASVSPDCVTVTVEHGGIAHYYRTLVFLKSADGTWSDHSEPFSGKANEARGR